MSLFQDWSSFYVFLLIDFTRACLHASGVFVLFFLFQFVSLSSEEIPWISLSIFPIDSPTNVLIFIFARRLSRFRIHFPSLRFLPSEFSLALCAVTYNTNFCFLFIFLYSFLYSLLCSLLLLVAFNSAPARTDIFRTKKYRKFCATLFH